MISQIEEAFCDLPAEAQRAQTGAKEGVNLQPEGANS